MTDPHELNRRRLLGCASTLVAALAGCAGGPVRTDDERPTRTASTRATVSGRADSEAHTGTRAARETPATEAGQEVDSIFLPSLDVRGSPGELVALRPEEKIVVLDFFATWCGPCEPEMENLRAAREQFSRETVFLISITSETDEEAVKQFWENNRGTWPVVKDPGMRAFQQYGVRNLPTILIFTPDGTEIMRHTGLAGEERLVTNIQEALGEDG